jgi:hypothetical protein
MTMIEFETTLNEETVQVEFSIDQADPDCGYFSDQIDEINVRWNGLLINGLISPDDWSIIESDAKEHYSELRRNNKSNRRAAKMGIDL